MVDFLKKYLYDPKFDICWGNHDTSYAFGYRCSGYDPHTQAYLNENMTEKDWRQFRPFVEVGPFLVSHAGFIDETLHLKDQAQEAVDLAFKGKRHRYWSAGLARGGDAPLGGPTWLDWNFEFEPIDGVPQIVGHTVQSNNVVGIKAGNYCLDTCNKHVIFIEEETGKVEILKV